MRVEIRAKSKVRGRKPGDIFLESRRIAKALVAIGRAEYVTRNVELDEVENKTLPGKMLVSKMVMDYADEKGVDLRTVTGSGANGRILKTDIDGLLE